MRHARDAGAGGLRDLAFYIKRLTGMIPGSDSTNPDVATGPKWHTVRHLPEKKGIIAADPIWNIPFHVCAITGGPSADGNASAANGFFERC